jgi:hypothetical protein
MSNTAFLLQGGNGGHVLNSGEGAQTGKSYRWIQMIEDTVFSTITGSNLTNTADLATITHLAGTGIGGNFTAVTVSSGTCIAYDQ